MYTIVTAMHQRVKMEQLFRILNETEVLISFAEIRNKDVFEYHFAVKLSEINPKYLIV